MRRLRLFFPAFTLLLSMCSLSAYSDDSLLLSLRGEAAPGALMIGQVLPGVSVSLNGKSLRTTGEGFFVFGFGRDDNGAYALQLQDGDKKEMHEVVLQPREWNIQRVEGVPQETVTPPPERLARIRKEGALVSNARKTNSNRHDFLTPFVWPASGPITGWRVFGWKMAATPRGWPCCRPTAWSSKSRPSRRRR